MESVLVEFLHVVTMIWNVGAHIIMDRIIRDVFRLAVEHFGEGSLHSTIKVLSNLFRVFWRSCLAVVEKTRLSAQSEQTVFDFSTNIQFIEVVEEFVNAFFDGFVEFLIVVGDVDSENFEHVVLAVVNLEAVSVVFGTSDWMFADDGAFGSVDFESTVFKAFDDMISHLKSEFRSCCDGDIVHVAEDFGFVF